MGQRSPCKSLRSIKRLTKFIEKKQLIFSQTFHNVSSKPVLVIFTLPQIDISPNDSFVIPKPQPKLKLSISHVQTTTVLPYQSAKPRLSIVHVERTTVPPQKRDKPKLSITHVQTTTVPPQPKPRPRLSIAHVQRTTLPPNPMNQVENKHLKVLPDYQ